MRAWLVAGPFPNAPDYEGKTYGLGTQWIGSEANAAPFEGKFLTHLRDAGIPEFWRLAATDHSELDFGSMLNGAKPGVAYAYACLVADHAMPAVISVIGAQTVRVLLNGKAVFEGGSGIRGASARIAAHLAKGPNRLLIKVVHTGGDWYQDVRVACQPGVHEQLDVYRTGAYAEPSDLRAIRAVRNKTGALDLDAAIAYDSSSRLASQWIDVFESDIPHPRALRSVIAEAARHVIAAQAKDANTISSALVKGTNMISLAFRQARAQAVAHYRHLGPLLKTNVAKEDYVRVSPGKRYFVHANGKPFVPIGFSPDTTTPDRHSWETLACFPCDPGYDPVKADAFFAKAADAGVDLLELPLDPDLYVQRRLHSLVKSGVDWGSPEHTKWIDTIMLLALKHRIKLLISVWDPYEGLPMNAKMLPSPSELPKEKQTWQAVIDRWGNSGAVMGWEIWPPLADALRPRSALIKDLKEVADFIRKTEKRRWGRTHLVTVAQGFEFKRQFIAEAKIEDFDRSVTGTYLKDAAGARAIRSDITEYAAPFHGSMPLLTLYVGSAYLPVPFDAAGWLELVSGDAGVISDDDRSEDLAGYLSLREFALHVDWSKLDSPKSEPFEATAPRRWMSSGFGNAKASILWAGGETLGDQIVLGPKAPIRAGRFKAYDCSAGKWIGEGTFRGSLAIPKGLKSVAWFTFAP